jgi:hypothetical protein
MFLTSFKGIVFLIGLALMSFSAVQLVIFSDKVSAFISAGKAIIPWFLGFWVGVFFVAWVILNPPKAKKDFWGRKIPNKKPAKHHH